MSAFRCATWASCRCATAKSVAGAPPGGDGADEPFEDLWSDADDEDCAATASFKPLEGREQAALDYKEVESIVRSATEGNRWVEASHGNCIADFLGHLAAASYASPELHAKTPAGYSFLPRVAFPHPDGTNRGRTAIAKSIVGVMQASKYFMRFFSDTC